jgi:hypothetical protein
MMRTRDALSEFLEALSQPENYDVTWDAAKGELHVRRLSEAERRLLRRRRSRSARQEQLQLHV